MTPTLDNGIVSKLRKLEALRSRAATEAEAVNAATRIQELLRKHNLEMDILHEPQKHEGTEVTAEENPSAGYRFSTRVHPYDQVLASAACRMTDTKYFCRQHRQTGVKSLHFVGLKSNIEAAVFLYKYFQQVSWDMLDARFKAGDVKGSQCRPYRMGVARKIQELVDKYRDDQEQYLRTDEKALIKLSSAVAEAYLKDVIKPNGTIGFNGRVRDVRSYRLGYDDGSQADITTSVRKLA